MLQRILEHCSDDEETRCIIDEILESAFALAHDQYGNYVTQVWLTQISVSLVSHFVLSLGFCVFIACPGEREARRKETDH